MSRSAARKAAQERKYYALAAALILPVMVLMGAVAYSVFNPHSLCSKVCMAILSVGKLFA